MIGKVFARVIAVIGAATLTLAATIALVQGTVFVVAIRNLPLRILALAGDVILGTLLLLGCIYLATHLAVRILGVAQAGFLPLPERTRQEEPPKL